jgi:hypothetical protein
MVRLLSATGFSLALVSGCAMEREWQDNGDPFDIESDDLFEQEEERIEPQPEEECWDCYNFEPSFGVENAHVGGHIGTFRDLDLAIDSPSVYEDPSWSYTNINLTGYRDDGDMGMIFMDVMNVAVADLPEGSNECNYDGGTGVQIMVTGCASGDLESEYYDAPATDCEVVVQHQPDGSTDVTVVASLPSFDRDGAQTGETTATAQFTVTPLE